MASSKTPVALLDGGNTESMKVPSDAAIKEALNKHGLTPQPTKRAELTAFMKKEDAMWNAIVRERKITGN